MWCGEEVNLHIESVEYQAGYVDGYDAGVNYGLRGTPLAFPVCFDHSSIINKRHPSAASFLLGYERGYVSGLEAAGAIAEYAGHRSIPCVPTTMVNHTLLSRR